MSANARRGAVRGVCAVGFFRGLAAFWLFVAPMAICRSSAAASPPAAKTQTGSGLSPAVSAAILDMRTTLARIRGHEFKATVPVSTLSEPEVRAFLLGKLEKDYPDEKIAAEQKAYVHFGFLKPDEDLKGLFIQMLSEQAAGFYDPDEKRLFLVSGKAFPGIALVHELAHALQDQTFGVTAIIDKSRGNDDALLAVQSMIEGEAMALTSKYSTMRPGSEELAGIAGPEVEPETSARETLEKLGRMPDILQENLMFPYSQGMTFANNVTKSGGVPMMDELFRHPPESSEQILHPEKIQEPRDRPSEIEPALMTSLVKSLESSGYRHVKTNTLGEFNLGQLFGGRGDERASSAAAGWDGDLYAIVERQGAGTGMIWITVWDSEGDASEFGQRVSGWMQARHPDSSGWLSLTPAGMPRVVCLMEGFQPDVAARLKAALDSGLAAGVRIR